MIPCDQGRGLDGEKDTVDPKIHLDKVNFTDLLHEQ